MSFGFRVIFAVSLLGANLGLNTETSRCICSQHGSFAKDGSRVSGDESMLGSISASKLFFAASGMEAAEGATFPQADMEPHGTPWSQAFNGTAVLMRAILGFHVSLG